MLRVFSGTSNWELRCLFIAFTGYQVGIYWIPSQCIALCYGLKFSIFQAFYVIKPETTEQGRMAGNTSVSPYNREKTCTWNQLGAPPFILLWYFSRSRMIQELNNKTPLRVSCSHHKTSLSPSKKQRPCLRPWTCVCQLVKLSVLFGRCNTFINYILWAVIWSKCKPIKYKWLIWALLLGNDTWVTVSAYSHLFNIKYLKYMI